MSSVPEEGEPALDVPRGLVSALADRYAFHAIVGRGSMADVYRARDLHRGRDVAIKVMRVRELPAEERMRFLREVRIVASLAHPNVIPLFDSGEDGDLLWYAMPLLAGGTLAQRLMRDGALPVAEAVRIACEVADGLAHAHGRGLVHRDIKPQNVLFGDGRALVADFGLARLLEGGSAVQVTPSSARLGTLLYMSPEQGLGGSGVDGRADQYSLACVLYEMLSGRPPFDAAQCEALVFGHARVVPRPIRERRPEVPSPVALALHRALHKLPDGRFRTMEEFAAALRDAPARTDGDHVGAR